MATDNLTITIEFSGGLEILFDNIPKHTVHIPKTIPTTTSPSTNPAQSDEKGNPTTIKDLIEWTCKNLMKDSRRELFVLDGNIRPGILVLINDADWELEGEDQYELKDRDNILFVSTLHGG